MPFLKTKLSAKYGVPGMPYHGIVAAYRGNVFVEILVITLKF